MKRKHAPVLICADVLCEFCGAAGVDVEREPQRRAPGCVCGVPWRGANRHRWCAPVDVNNIADEQQMPPDGLNARRLLFHSFDAEEAQLAADPRREVVAQFADFLLHTGTMACTTLLLSHNGVGSSGSVFNVIRNL